MSGHSKWSTIKRKKGKIDAERGKIFTRLIREITVAARHGGANPDSNPRLRTAIAAAKESSMPADNIKRAIMKGTGELPGQIVEEITYEGYGPGGAAVLVEVVTDNKNRVVSEIRHIFDRNSGNLGASGSVAWIFSKQGYFTVEKSKIGEDDLLSIVLDAGASDLQTAGDVYEIYTPFHSFEAVRQILEKNKIPAAQAEITMTPSTTVRLEGKEAEHMLKLMEALEEHDDVQKVYSNFDIDEAVMEKMTAS
ncbi:MAG: YebC/PmpR family DNA-binding transcriptional regulator [Limisphaerales bacterium]